ncbi:uncharacterized protein LOC142629792 isoform X2 [Castanea sativa]|uniref:uncharacterized protein LOC142629792 isoform X2 n=1 Tax=Castanea sativa TaxID=21020 RepID=UPI003F64AC38
MAEMLKQMMHLLFTRTKELASRAIEELNNSELKGKKVKCSASQAKHRFFIGNVPRNWGEADMKKAVTEIGPGVISVELLTILDPHNSSRYRGFAFIEYHNNACAEYSKQKMSNPQFKLDKNAPTVSWVDPKNAESSAASQISEYVEHNDAILLVVIPATQAPELSLSRALKIVKEFDAESTRTVGIISKIDQAASEPKALAAVQAPLLNQGPPKTSDIPWVALIGQSVSIASAQSGAGSENSLETAWRAESESLKSILTGAPQSKLGRVALVEALAGRILNCQIFFLVFRGSLNLFRMN